MKRDDREFKREEKKYLCRRVKKIFLNRIESLRNNLHILTFKHLSFFLCYYYYNFPLCISLEDSIFRFHDSALIYLHNTADLTG